MSAPGPIPVDLQIEFVKAAVDAERLARDTHRRDAFDGGKLWAEIQSRIDARLDDLFVLMIERDGIDVPDCPVPA
jgi:hypothetical protein